MKIGKKFEQYGLKPYQFGIAKRCVCEQLQESCGIRVQELNGDEREMLNVEKMDALALEEYDEANFLHKILCNEDIAVYNVYKKQNNGTENIIGRISLDRNAIEYNQIDFVKLLENHGELRHNELMRLTYGSAIVIDNNEVDTLLVDWRLAYSYQKDGEKCTADLRMWDIEENLRDKIVKYLYENTEH